MQPKRSLIVGASLGALMNLGMAGASVAQQSSDTTPPPKPHKTKAQKAKTVKAAAPTEQQQMAAQIQALRDQIDALQRRV